jgi:hypothetical protein
MRFDTRHQRLDQRMATVHRCAKSFAEATGRAAANRATARRARTPPEQRFRRRTMARAPTFLISASDVPGPTAAIATAGSRATGSFARQRLESAKTAGDDKATKPARRRNSDRFAGAV